MSVKQSRQTAAVNKREASASLDSATPRATYVNSAHTHTKANTVKPTCLRCKQAYLHACSHRHVCAHRARKRTNTRRNRFPQCGVNVVKGLSFPSLEIIDQAQLIFTDGYMTLGCEYTRHNQSGPRGRSLMVSCIRAF